MMTGAKTETATDIHFVCPGFVWKQQRTYNSALDGDWDLGNRWLSGNKHLRLNKVSGGIELIVDASSKFEFLGNDSSGYEGPEYKRLSVTHDPSADEYELFNAATGAITVFHDFTVAEARRGKIKEVTREAWRAAGKSGLSYIYDSSGYLVQIETSTGQDCSIAFSHNSNSRLASVEVVDTTTSPDTIFQRVEYTYKSSGPGDDIGTIGDLVLVKRSWQAPGDTGATLSNVSYTHYRYHADSRLKAVYNDRDIASAIADNANLTAPGDLLTKADGYSTGFSGSTSLKDYAGKWVTYYSSPDPLTSEDMSHWDNGGSSVNLTTELGFSVNRDEEHFVKSQRIGAVGCSSCGTGTSVTKNYYYLETTAISDDNAVKYLFVEDTLDAADDGVVRKITGLNDTGRELRQVYTNAPYDSPEYWCSSTKLELTSVHQTTGKEQRRYRVIESRMPSAHDVTDSTDLKNFLKPLTGAGWGNDTGTLHANAGVIYTYQYNDQGRLTDSFIKRGVSGTKHYVSATDWGGGGKDYLKSKEYVFPTKTTNKNDGVFWGFGYTFWEIGGVQTDTIKTQTITLPTVDSSQNGPGGTVTIEAWYDQTGRQRWSKDAEGYVHYQSYDKVTGQSAYNAIDVNPASLPTLAGNADLLAVTDGGADSAKPSRAPSLTQFPPVERETFTEFDDQGRALARTDPSGHKHASVRTEDRSISFPLLNSSGVPQGVISVVERDDLGRTTESYGVRADFTDVSTENNLPTGFSPEPDQEDYVSWTRYEHDDHGRVRWVDRYHQIPSSGEGSIGTNFYRTAFLYDSLGRRAATVQYVDGSEASATVQISFTAYDWMGRAISRRRWRETAFDLQSASTDLTFGDVETTAINKPLTSRMKYDGGGVGDSHVTASWTYHTESGGAEDLYTYTKYHRDFRGRVRGTERFFDNDGTGTPLGPFTVVDLDWMGRTTAIALFDDVPTWSTATGGDGDTEYAETTTTDRRGLSRTMYDNLNRVYQTEQVVIKQSDGSVIAAMRTNNYYNRRGDLVATEDPEGLSMEYAYDGAGRRYQSRTVTTLEATKYSSGEFQYRAPEPTPSLASSGGDDEVLTLAHTIFDDDGQVVEQHQFDMNHYDTNGLDLDGSDCVRTTSHTWYNDIGRATATANYGSGDGSSSDDEWEFNTAPSYDAGDEPEWTDAAVYNGYVQLVTYGYDSETLRQDLTTMGIRKATGSSTETVATKTFYDDAGRRLAVAENYVNFSLTSPTTTCGGGTNNDEDRATRWEYDGIGNTTKLIAYNAGATTVEQVTEYRFEDDYNARLTTKEIYPDGDALTDNVTIAYHLDGSPDRRADQRGVVFEYTYDDHRRTTLQAAITLPVSGSVDSFVRAIGRAYDDLGRTTTVTSYAGTDTSSTVRNQIKYTYDDDHGRVIKEEQNHSTTVSSGDPAVEYAFDETNSSGLYTNGLHMTSTTYPSGRQIDYGYGSAGSISDRAGRVIEMTESSTTLTSYEYTGGGRLVSRELGTTTTIERNADRDDNGVYGGWDRFGRVESCQWIKGGGGAWNAGDVRDLIHYRYDLAGNRTARNVRLDLMTGDAPGTDVRDQDYEYDNLHRLIDADEGTASTTTHLVTTQKFEQQWDLDPLGNWDGFKENTDGAGVWEIDQTRTHNEANELETITTWANPAHDKAGNMTTIPQPTNPTASYTAKYDAWNRLVSLDDGLTRNFEYDGLNRRIKRREGSTTTHFYYNNQWQCVEERAGSSTSPAKQYVWHPEYIDALALTYDSSGTKHFYLFDALYNVTAVTNNAGTVIERYAYTPYGEATVLDADFTTDANGESDIENEHLFTGRRTDPGTGLQLNRNRFYHQQLGRWVSRDPIGYEGSKWNLYELNSSDAVSGLDPHGLGCVVPYKCLLAGVKTLKTDPTKKDCKFKCTEVETAQHARRFTNGNTCGACGEAVADCGDIPSNHVYYDTKRVGIMEPCTEYEGSKHYSCFLPPNSQRNCSKTTCRNRCDKYSGMASDACSAIKDPPRKFMCELATMIGDEVCYEYCDMFCIKP